MPLEQVPTKQAPLELALNSFGRLPHLVLRRFMVKTSTLPTILNAFTLIFVNTIAHSAVADESQDNRFNIYLSAYQPTIDTSIRFDANEVDLGTNLNLEETAQLVKMGFLQAALRKRLHCYT